MAFKFAFTNLKYIEETIMDIIKAIKQKDFESFNFLIKNGAPIVYSSGDKHPIFWAIEYNNQRRRQSIRE